MVWLLFLGISTDFVTTLLARESSGMIYKAIRNAIELSSLVENYMMIEKTSLPK